MIAVCGGSQGRPAGITDRSHRGLYDRAVLLWLDPVTGALAEGLTWRSRADVCGDPAAVGHRFGAPFCDGAVLWLCTEREILRCEAGSVDVISHPWMADLHHVCTFDGTVWGVATGLDAVIGCDGRWLAADPRARLPTRDVRALPLPRARAHPNYAFVWDGTLWATCGRTGDVRSQAGLRWSVASVVIHDGVVAPDGVWFTAVDGRLIRVNPNRGTVDRVVDLRQPEDGPEPLGWCRGLALVDGWAFVGFTRIRTTAWRAGLAWTRGALRGRPVATRRPTRIGVFDLATGRRVREVLLPMDAVFGLAETSKELCGKFGGSGLARGPSGPGKTQASW